MSIWTEFPTFEKPAKVEKEHKREALTTDYHPTGLVHWLDNNLSAACDSTLTLAGLHPSIRGAKEWPAGNYWVGHAKYGHLVNCEACKRAMQAEEQR